MKNPIFKFLTTDRRAIFLLVGLAVVIPLLAPLGLPVDITKPARDFYESIEALEPTRGPLLLSMDYDPGTVPELNPMSIALLRHCFDKNIRVVVMTLLPGGPGLAEQVTTQISQEFNNTYGEDYVYLGYKVGTAAVMLSMGEDIHGTFPLDYYGTPVGELPMMQEIKTLADIPLIVTISGTQIIESWIAYAGARYHKTIAAGATAVMVPQFYPYLQTDQLVGLLGGLKGAAEYEELVHHLDFATVGMDVQSIVHFLIVLLVIFGNIGYFIQRRSKSKV